MSQSPADSHPPKSPSSVSAPAPRPAAPVEPDDQPTVIRHRPPLPLSSGSDAQSPFDKWGLAPGDRLGDFELQDYVGGGGMGRVFRAMDLRLARPVALKVLSPDQAADANTVLRFQNEAQSAARLDHQNIARVHYVGEDRGIPFIVFEFIEGINIRDLVVKEGPLPLVEALSYTWQIGQGLAHAASRNVVHRDIKPSNVLITEGGVAKLIDLGLARLSRVSTPADELTASGVTLGTFDYISPEQARDPRNADARSDIYSLGCTLFFMLAGRPPFPEGTVLQKLLQHQGDPPPEIRELRPDLPESVGRLLRKMLAKDPRLRQQTPGELLEELAALSSEVGLDLGSPAAVTWTPPATSESRWARHLPWALPAAILVTIVVALDWTSRRSALSPAEQPAVRAPDATASAPPRSDAARPVEPLAAKHPADVPEGSAAAPIDLTGPARFISRLTAMQKSGQLLRMAPGDGGWLAAPGTTGQLGLVGSSVGDSTGERPRATAASPTPGPVKTAVLVVGHAEEGERQFESLQAACEAAASGEVVELRFDGRRNESSFTLPPLQLTIRANEKYRPVVVFQGDASGDSHGMLRVSGGHLTWLNCALEWQPPRTPSGQHMALIEIHPGAALRLEKCSLTARVPEAAKAWPPGALAFLSLRPRTADEGPGTGSTAPPATIGLEDTWCRGPAILVRAVDSQPFSLTWANGLLASSESLLSLETNGDVGTASDLRQIDLRHLTAVVPRGLCRFDCGVSGVPAAPLRIRTANSIFIGAPGAAMIEQTARARFSDAKALLQWIGDHNFYERWEMLWRVGNPDDLMLPVEQLSLEDWLARWGPQLESIATANKVLWKGRMPPAVPLSQQTPGDYAIDPSPANAARSSASDGADAGMQLEDLPPDPVAAEGGSTEVKEVAGPKAETRTPPAPRP